MQTGCALDEAPQEFAAHCDVQEQKSPFFRPPVSQVLVASQHTLAAFVPQEVPQPPQEFDVPPSGHTATPHTPVLVLQEPFVQSVLLAQPSAQASADLPASVVIGALHLK